MKAETRWHIVRFFITAFALFGLWLAFTANFSGFSLISGLFGSILIATLTYDVFIARHQADLHYILPNPFHLFTYMFVMVFALYKASIMTLLAVGTGKVNPRIIYFRTRLRSDIARMVLANSITITPGTITLDLDDDHLIVHWLCSTTTHSKGAGEIVKGSLERHIQKVWS